VIEQVMDDSRRQIKLTGTVRNVLAACAAVGAISAIAGAFAAPDRMWASWLLVASYVLGIGLGGLSFLAIHYTTGATWSVAIRRVPEALAGTLPLALAMMAVLFVVYPQLYGWTTDATLAAGANPAMAFKRMWLSRPFFLARAVAYAAIWLFFAAAIRMRSRRQDEDGDPNWSRSNVRLSAVFLILFGITVTLASFDWLMSLEHHWFSTIYGVYSFAGLFESGLAAIILVAVWLEWTGSLTGVVNDNHLHDLGKLLFAFSVFWAYIWFSQYMLIWYTNIPEETAYFVLREHGGWFVLSMLNIVLNGVVPFVVLLRQDAKRHRTTLALAAGGVLLGRWLDLYVLIFPAVVGDAPTFGIWEIGITLGGVGALGLVLARELRAAPAVPVSDPDLLESLQYGH
jgi:hypothetical protein